jgi:phosphate transport system substrate-binding protein
MKLMQTAFAGMAGALFAIAAQAADITGAGSTFAAPIYTKWADAYQKTGGGKVNYQGIGSSGGVKQIVAKTVDFAGSDAPLKDDELAKEGLFQFPTVVGGVVPVINVPGVKAGEITLSGEVLGDIYLGKVKKWNDPAIAALNPKVKLPDTDIAVVRRADGSGTSFIWTNYLSKVNPEWKSKIGEGSTVNWPTGTGGKGNDGVAAFVQRLPGAIGYVEWAYAKQNHMTYVDLKNSAGTVVEPKTETRQRQLALTGRSRSTRS